MCSTFLGNIWKFRPSWALTPRLFSLWSDLKFLEVHMANKPRVECVLLWCIPLLPLSPSTSATPAMKVTIVTASLSTVEVEKSGRSEKGQSGTDTGREREREDLCLAIALEASQRFVKNRWSWHHDGCLTVQANTVESTWRQIRVEAGPYLSDKKRLQRYKGFYTYVFKVPMDEFFFQRRSSEIAKRKNESNATIKRKKRYNVIEFLEWEKCKY